MDSARGGRLLVVSGAPGIGKTSLAVHWSHQIRSEFPDGILFEDLHGYAPDGPCRPVESLGRFVRAFGLDPRLVPGELADLTGAYRSLTADKRILVVLDDALTAAQVIPLLPPSAESLTIVTSRRHLGALVTRGARIVHLNKLHPDAALELLSSMIGDNRPAAEPHAARELVELCGGVPLAVCVAGARLASRSTWQIREMVDALAHESRRLASLTLEGDMAVRSSLEVSYQVLRHEAARVYRLMGLYPGIRFESGAAAAGTSLPSNEARGLLEGLADANLIEEEPGGHFRFFDLTRLHAIEKAEQEESEPTRAAAIRRMLDWFLATASLAGQTLTPYRQDLPAEARVRPTESVKFNGRDAALDWLDRELPEVMAVARFAAEHAEPTVTWQLADAMWPVFLYRGHLAERLEFDQLGLRAAQAAGDQLGEAKMIYRLGLAHLDLAHHDEADAAFRQAESAWNAMGNAGRVAGCLRRLGFVAAARDRYTEAITYFRKALAAYSQLNQRRHVGLTLIDLGNALTRTEQAEEAIAVLHKARALLPQDVDPYNAARLLIGLGCAHHHAGQHDLAVEHLNQALTSMRSIGSDRGEAEALVSLGRLAEDIGEADQARNRYVEASKILIKLGSPQAQAVADRLA